MTIEKNNTNNLAIVIPAYKAGFFDKALKSIANQTCKNFTLYVGDDGSPEDIKTIIEKYTDDINIVYHRFSDNLGGTDLVSQWHRCIDLTKEEEWIWLFSDDDEMDSNCVQAFYDTLISNSNFDLFRFHIEQIDQDSKVIGKNKLFPEIISSEELLLERLKGNFHLTVIEYIFRKEKYIKVGKFQNFDLAYCSDDASWLKMSRDTGIRLIRDAKVYWRISFTNISTVKNKKVKYRQSLAGLEYVKWVKEFTKEYISTLNGNELNKLIFKWYTNSFFDAFMQISNYKLILMLIKINKLTEISMNSLSVSIKLLFERNYNAMKSFIKHN